MVEVTAATEHLHHLVEDLQHQAHSPINKKNHSFKKFQRIKTPVHHMSVAYSGDRTLPNQSNKKLHLTKQPTNQLQLPKTKRMQCSLNLRMVKKEWMKIAMMMHRLRLLNRNNQRPHQLIYLIWEGLRMLSR